MLISGLFILLLVSAVSQERINGIIINRTGSLILFYSFIVSLMTLNISTIGSGIGIYGGLYQVTVITKIIECFIYLLGAMILSNTLLQIKSNNNNNYNNLNSLDSYKNNNNNNNTQLINQNNNDVNIVRSEYSIIALFTIVGSILLITSNDLVSMYLSIELQSFSLYVLATIYRNSQSATYAGLKYFLLGGLSSCFILLGSSIIYSYGSITNLEGIYLLLSTTQNNSILPSLFISEKISFPLIEIGILIMVIGFLFKIASAPFHNWAPDVYDGVPTKVTTWLAIMAKISILTFLLDLSIGFSSGNNTLLSLLLLICSLLSLLIGTIVGLGQYRIKRLLAYSTISHVGFLLLAIGINTEDSIESFIFYIIQYSLTSANAFFILIAFGDIIKKYTLSSEEYSPVEFISQLKGQFKLNPLLALTMAVTLFSMAGIPPLIGFFGKQTVLLSAVKNGYVFLAIIGIITSVISAGYYLRVIKVMHFDKIDEIIEENNKNNNNNNNVNENKIVMSNTLSFSISVLTIITIFFVLKPTLILNSAHIMALSIFYI